MAEEEGVIFMLEETCNRVKLALAQATDYTVVRDWIRIRNSLYSMM